MFKDEILFLKEGLTNKNNMIKYVLNQLPKRDETLS